MPNEKKKNVPQMRAATRGEQASDRTRNVYESLGEQPLARIADLLGISDIEGVVKEYTEPGMKMKGTAMSGPPGKGILRNLEGRTSAGRPDNTYKLPFEGRDLTKNQRDANTAVNWGRNEYRRSGPAGRPPLQGNTPNESKWKQEDYLSKEARNQQKGDRINERIRAERTSNPYGMPDDRAVAAPMRGNVPSEFHAVEPNPRSMSGRSDVIDPMKFDNDRYGIEMLTDFPSNQSGEAYALEEAMLRKQRQARGMK